MLTSLHGQRELRPITLRADSVDVCAPFNDIESEATERGHTFRSYIATMSGVYVLSTVDYETVMGRMRRA